VREKRYGLADRMSSTGAAGAGAVFSDRTAGFVLTGASVLWGLMSLDELSERYAEHNRNERGAGFVFAGPEREALFKRYVGGPGRRVLDLGCRDGALTRVYLDGNDVIGVDADREALAAAAGLGIETHWADLDRPLDFPDAGFDVVVAGELLEHLRDPQRLVGEVRRVLRPGGTFVASVPNAYRLKRRVLFLFGRPPDDDPTHLQMFSPAGVRALLDGFDKPQLHFVAGRLVPLHARLFANDIVFAGLKPS
jgi:SAM-dependent methyltransferase